jgi:hypothetical protein
MARRNLLRRAIDRMDSAERRWLTALDKKYAQTFPRPQHRTRENGKRRRRRRFHCG